MLTETVLDLKPWQALPIAMMHFCQTVSNSTMLENRYASNNLALCSMQGDC
jgi:hypothetical protein